MAITYYMLQIPSFILFLLLVGTIATLAGFGAYIFRKIFKITILKSHNEVTGYLFLAIASFYALLLSFIVLIVWEQLNETKSNVSLEGSSALALYRDIKYFPDSTISQKIMNPYLFFVENVIKDEFPKMQRLERSRNTTEAFNRVYKTMENIKSKDPLQIQLTSSILNHLNQLATYRALRLDSMENEIAPAMWFPIILGMILTIFCAILLDIEHFKMHIGLISFLGAFIGMFLFIIILVDHPFTGKMGVTPSSFEHILTLETWNDEIDDIKNDKINELKK